MTESGNLIYRDIAYRAYREHMHMAVTHTHTTAYGADITGFAANSSAAAFVLQIAADAFAERVSRRGALLCYKPYKVAVDGQDHSGKTASGDSAACCKYCYGLSGELMQMSYEFLILRAIVITAKTAT